ncbi:Hypothetical predicted protein [Mytilus galloprovincialis]|uniref:Uncharacterized protein n=1 Tax=Mytilus galloprovincialis TaxID=29158 RepID=A0A8B6C2L5_MYTGA|nr:Hypothetical predicted protein [Mytilus galloprovincialis]
MADSIYICNASSHNFYVKVACDIEYQQGRNIAVGANAGNLGGVGVQVNQAKKWSESDKFGYTILNRYSSMKFHQDFSKKVCYVTIKFEPDDTDSLCENHGLGVNCGLIIDSSCYVHNAKPGLRWTDIDGICHKPNLKNKEDLPKDFKCSIYQKLKKPSK